MINSSDTIRTKIWPLSSFFHLSGVRLASKHSNPESMRHTFVPIQMLMIAAMRRTCNASIKHFFTRIWFKFFLTTHTILSIIWSFWSSIVVFVYCRETVLLTWSVWLRKDQISKDFKRWKKFLWDLVLKMDVKSTMLAHNFYFVQSSYENFHLRSPFTFYYFVSFQMKIFNFHLKQLVLCIRTVSLLRVLLEVRKELST